MTKTHILVSCPTFGGNIYRYVPTARHMKTTGAVRRYSCDDGAYCDIAYTHCAYKTTGVAHDGNTIQPKHFGTLAEAVKRARSVVK